MTNLGVAVFAFAFSAFGISAVAEDSRNTPKFYYPNTEVLGEAEMRVVSLGTGTPNFRHSQASASWLVELAD